MRERGVSPSPSTSLSDRTPHRKSSELQPSTSSQSRRYGGSDRNNGSGGGGGRSHGHGDGYGFSVIPSLPSHQHHPVSNDSFERNHQGDPLDGTAVHFTPALSSSRSMTYSHQIYSQHSPMSPHRDSLPFPPTSQSDQSLTSITPNVTIGVDVVPRPQRPINNEINKQHLRDNSEENVNRFILAPMQHLFSGRPEVLQEILQNEDPRDMEGSRELKRMVATAAKPGVVSQTEADGIFWYYDSDRDGVLGDAEIVDFVEDVLRCEGLWTKANYEVVVGGIGTIKSSFDLNNDGVVDQFDLWRWFQRCRVMGKSAASPLATSNGDVSEFGLQMNSYSDLMNGTGDLPESL